MRDEKGCPNCRTLKAENQALRAEIRSLKQRIERLEKQLRKDKRQATPFGRDKSSDNKKGKPGRKAGNGKFSRRKPPPEGELETLDVPLDCCPNCGGPLADKKRHQHFQSDIPLARPVHRCYVTQSGYCPNCKRRFRSRHPEQTSTATGAAGVSVGPNARAVAADMKHRLGVSYAKSAELFRTVFGLQVSRSALCQSSQRLADKADPVYEELLEAIRDCCGVHADETGWRIGILSAWLWVFASRTITVYTIRQSRAHDVVVEVLGRKFKGVLHSDCFMAYDSKELAGWLQQKCFAHFLHQLSEMEREKTRGAVRFPRNVLAVLREALALRDKKAELSAQEFARRLSKIEKRLDDLISGKRNFTDPDNRRFAKRLRKQRRHLFTFLTHEGVEATNNRAERALRPAVIVRKTGGCNKTHSGARTHAVLASILTTARQQKIGVIEYLSSLACCRDKPPSLLAPTPG